MYTSEKIALAILGTLFGVFLVMVFCLLFIADTESWTQSTNNCYLHTETAYHLFDDDITTITHYCPVKD